MQFSRPLILASKSPRRSQLLQEAGIAFTVKTFDVDETYPEDLPTDEVAPFLAEKKAMAALDLINDTEIVLTADSVVILDDIIYGKPENRADARRILKALSGRTHTVITGVCLLAKDHRETFSGISKVCVEELSEEEIDFYIEKYAPMDKAGAYGVQEWLGLCKISAIEGTYSNIMGLPVNLVYESLKRFHALK